jgi:hypothetical protein
MRQTNAAATMFRLNTFKALLQLQCPTGAPLRYAVCHTFSSSFLRSGSSCGLRLTSFFSSFVPLHFVSFTALLIAYAARRRSQLTKQCFAPPGCSSNPVVHFTSFPLHYVIHSLQ